MSDKESKRKSDKVMTDESLMPFGKHQSKRLVDVPAGYFKWLAGQEWLELWPGLHDYVEDNMHVFEHELKNRR